MAKLKQEVNRERNHNRNIKRKLKRHIDKIGSQDQQFKRAVAEFGYPEPRVRAAGFETLLSIIVSQQISTGAAAAITERLRAVLPDMTAQSVMESEPILLREAGLSGRKVEYAFGLAQSICEGRFDPQALAEMDDACAIKKIVALRGFGQWSAEIYLMFSLQRSDIFPADDLALQLALQRLKKLEQRPTAKQARGIVQDWAPCRSAGSLFLWHYYRGAPA